MFEGSFNSKFPRHSSSPLSSLRSSFDFFSTWVSVGKPPTCDATTEPNCQCHDEQRERGAHFEMAPLDGSIRDTTDESFWMICFNSNEKQFLCANVMSYVWIHIQSALYLLSKFCRHAIAIYGFQKWRTLFAALECPFVERVSGSLSVSGWKLKVSKQLKQGLKAAGKVRLEEGQHSKQVMQAGRAQSRAHFSCMTLSIFSVVIQVDNLVQSDRLWTKLCGDVRWERSRPKTVRAIVHRFTDEDFV